MKKFIILTLIFTLTTLSLKAQYQNSRDKFQALKIAFLTDRLDLTTKEAQVFWPIFNEYEAKKDAIRKDEYKEVRSKIFRAEHESLSEEESKQYMKSYLAIEQRKFNAEKEFYTKLYGKLPYKKIILLIRAEEEFKNKMIREYSKRQQFMEGPSTIKIEPNSRNKRNRQ